MLTSIMLCKTLHDKTTCNASMQPVQNTVEVSYSSSTKIEQNNLFHGQEDVVLTKRNSLQGAHLVLDVTCPVGILERVQCLHEVTVRGTDAGDHQGLAERVEEMDKDMQTQLVKTITQHI